MTNSSRSLETTSILIPAYGGAEKLRNCLLSLSRNAPAHCPVIVLDDATPDSSVEECCTEAQAALPGLRYVRAPQNRGFVATCNWGYAEIAEKGTDILLLNSDTEVTAGFLEEMNRVLYLHERHAVVTPRSNNATVFSVPWKGSLLSAAESYEIWQAIHPTLPDYQLMPTAVGFCMLIKASILEKFGLFDEIYSPGYNEENDFVCRINRYGYSAVAANHAFVFHHEKSTFGSRRSDLERAHRKVLLERYPEYERKVSEYIASHLDPVENFAFLRSKHRPRILFDLFHLPRKHSGTSEFGLNLLRELYPLLEDTCDFFVGVDGEAGFFSNQLNGYPTYHDRPGSEAMFDLVFKPSQIFTWTEFRRMNRLAPRLSFVLQDIIAIRCDYLTSSDRKVIFRKTVELADRVFTISKYSQSDFRAFFDLDIPMQVIYHGTNLGTTPGEFLAGEYVLVMGNAYTHKGIAEALAALEGVSPIVVLGGDEPAEKKENDTRWVISGRLDHYRMRELIAKARVLVYPSHYEGFGLPVADALALGKQVIVLDSDVNRELADCVRNGNLSLIRSHRELKPLVQKCMGEAPGPPPREVRRWDAVGKEYARAIRELLDREPDIDKMRDRWNTLRLLETAAHP